jgi:hypothetical protein
MSPFILGIIKNTKTVYGQNAEFFHVKAGGTYRNRYALKD